MRSRESHEDLSRSTFQRISACILQDLLSRECCACLFVWLVGWFLNQQLGYIADGPQDRVSDNFMCCHACVLCS